MKYFFILSLFSLLVVFCSCKKNEAPSAPINPTPSDNDTVAEIDLISWNASSDPDGDNIVYDIYFGNTTSPTLVKSNHTTTSYSELGNIEYGTYYWKIVSKDSEGNETTGSLWRFTLSEENTSNQEIIWNQISSPISSNLYSVKFNAGVLCAAADGYLLKSDDDGITWSEMHTNSNEVYYDIEFSSTSIGYAVAVNKSNGENYLYKTIDGGITWENIHTCLWGFSSQNYKMASVSTVSDLRIIFGFGEAQWSSLTGGKSVHWAGESSCNSMFFRDVNTAISIGKNGASISEFGGLAYGYLTMGYNNNTGFDAASNIGIGLCPDYNEIHLIAFPYISNSSSTKSKILETCNGKLFGVDVVSSSTAILVGENGLIYVSRSGFGWDGSSTYINNFNEYQSPVNSRLNSVLFISDQIGIIVGDNGVILRTTNANLSTQPESGKTPYSKSLPLFNVISSPLAGDLYDVEITQNYVYIAGSTGILKGDINGNSFDLIKSDASINFTNISFVSDQVGWIGGEKSGIYEIYYTNDGGNNWTFQYSLSGSITSPQKTPTLRAKDQSVVYCSVNEFNRAFTTDGGNNWTSEGSVTQGSGIYDFRFTGNGNQGIGAWGTKCMWKDDISDLNQSWYSQFIHDFDPTFQPSDLLNGYQGGNKVSISNDGMAYMASDADGQGSGIHQAPIGMLFKTSSGNLSNTTNNWNGKWVHIPVCLNGIYTAPDNSNIIWTVGNKGNIARSLNGGKAIGDVSDYHLSWEGCESNTWEDLLDVEFANEQTGYIVGRNGVILKTTNGNAN